MAFNIAISELLTQGVNLVGLWHLCRKLGIPIFRNYDLIRFVNI
jgi:hypothetical protein